MLPQYPQFTPLRLDLKEDYNQLVGHLPPYSDISFATLQIWWNLSERLSVAVLNGNVVIEYVLPFDTKNSGLSLVGKHQVEESMQTIFATLKAEGKAARLVHVPEFVIERLEHQDLYQIDEEPDYNEYLLDTAALSKLEGGQYLKLRRKIREFQRAVADKRVDIRSIELNLEHVQDQLMASIADWEAKNSADNDPEHTEHAAIKNTLKHAAPLDIKNLSLFIDDTLHGIMIYHRPLGKEYYVLHHLKADYGTPYISDYLHHEMAKRAVADDVSTINIEMDLGIENLKEHKRGLRPKGYFKKYTVSLR